MGCASGYGRACIWLDPGSSRLWEGTSTAAVAMASIANGGLNVDGNCQIKSVGSRTTAADLRVYNTRNNPEHQESCELLVSYPSTPQLHVNSDLPRSRETLNGRLPLDLCMKRGGVEVRENVERNN